jgi:hypothetical protein
MRKLFRGNLSEPSRSKPHRLHRTAHATPHTQAPPAPLAPRSTPPAPSRPPPCLLPPPPHPLQKRAYKVKEWTDTDDFLTQLARLSGRLLKGGDPDLNTAARMVLYDWQRGKIPFFTLPPNHTDEAPGSKPVAPAAEAAAAAAEEPTALPVPRELVTEEDAVGEVGAKPEVAAAGEPPRACSLVLACRTPESPEPGVTPERTAMLPPAPSR